MNRDLALLEKRIYHLESGYFYTPRAGNKDLALLTERIEALENYNRWASWASILILLMFGLLTYLFMKVEGFL